MNTIDDSLQDHLNDPGRLAALQAVALLDTSAEAAFDRLTRLAARFTGAPVALVSLVDADRQCFKSCIGLPEPWCSRRETPLSHSFCQHNRTAGVPLIITDARTHPLFRNNPAVRDLSVIAYLGIPLVSPDGYVLGSFCVIDTKPRSWTEEEVKTLTDLAAVVMTEIHLRTEIIEHEKTEKERDHLAELNSLLQEEALARRRAEKTFQESEGRFRSIFEQAAVGVALIESKTGRFLDINRRYCEIVGYSIDELTGGRTFLEITHPDDLQPDLDNMARLMAGEVRSFSMEKRYFHKDGSIVWVNLTVSPTWKAGEEPDAHVAVVEDITEFKQAEAVIRHERNLSDQIINSVPGLIYLFDQDGRFLRWNRNFGTAIGYADDEISRIHPLELFRGADRDLVAERIRKAFETGQADVEAALVAKDGRTTPYYFTGRRIEYEGRACLAGMGIDISERKMAEAALRDSEKRFRDLVGMLPITVYETDRSLKLTFANRHAQELFGYSEKDLAQAIYSLDLIDPQDHDRAMANLARRLKGEDPGTLEYRARKKDGSSFPILLKAASMIKDGEFAGLRGIIVDISDRIHQEKERLEISDQLRQAQKMESIGRLAGGVAHDLNNMLSPIIGYAELLLDEFDRHDRRREYADQIFGAGMRAKDIVHQLLAFSRKQTLEYRPTTLNKILADFETLLRRTIREDIDIDIATSAETPVIMADTGQIEQVVMNLAVNAQDAMPQGGKLVFETGMAELDEGYVERHPGTTPGRYALLTVGDSGIGIDEATRQFLFEPFFSTKGDQGTGLGLATVYGIVKQHGGNIWVYSEPGMGTTFKIYLPIPEKERSSSDSASKAHADLSGSETILIVEDDEHVRLLAHEILTRKGYTILVAENGADALKALSAYGRPVDMLLTDVVMPEMNGKELYSQAVNQFPGLKVLFMSGYTDDIIAHHGILGKGVPFINKPFSADNLSIRVRSVLDAPQRLETE